MEPHRLRKSLGAEDTFAQDILDLDAARSQIRHLSAKVWTQCQARGLTGRTVTLKVKFADFRQITRSRTFAAPLTGLPDLLGAIEALLAPVFPPPIGVRLLGVTLSSLEGRGLEGPGATMPPAPRQLSLWQD